MVERAVLLHQDDDVLDVVESAGRGCTRPGLPDARTGARRRRGAGGAEHPAEEVDGG